MKDFLYAFLIIISLFYFVISLDCAICNYKLLYKKWLYDKNLFGKGYVLIAIIITLPIKILVYVWNFLFFIGYSLYRFGIKNTEESHKTKGKRIE